LWKIVPSLTNPISHVEIRALQRKRLFQQLLEISPAFSPFFVSRLVLWTVLRRTSFRTISLWLMVKVYPLPPTFSTHPLSINFNCFQFAYTKQNHFLTWSFNQYDLPPSIFCVKCRFRNVNIFGSKYKNYGKKTCFFRVQNQKAENIVATEGSIGKSRTVQLIQNHLAFCEAGKVWVSFIDKPCFRWQCREALWSSAYTTSSTILGIFISQGADIFGS